MTFPEGQHVRTRPGDAEAGYARELSEQLKRVVDGEVRFDAGSRAAYSTDASNYRQPPVGVVIPRNSDDVIETLAACRRFGAPVLGRGGGTSLAGQCCNTGVVLDFSKYMNRVLEIDAAGRLARVQPGVVLDHLRHVSGRHGLTYGPDPATHSRCTLGGMIGNNSCGVHSQYAGRTDQQVEELEIVTYRGERMRVGRTSESQMNRLIEHGGSQGRIYSQLRRLRDHYGDLIRERFPDIPRRVSGFNLPWLLPENDFQVARALTGSESTCAITLEATVRLVHKPEAKSLVVLGFADAYQAADRVVEIAEFQPTAIEGIDHVLVQDIQKKELHVRYLDLLPEGSGWLLVEFGGESKEEADANAKRMMQSLKRKANPPSMSLYDDLPVEQKLWELRESGLGATAFVPGQPDAWPGWEDSAVPPEKFGDYLRALRNLLDDYGYKGAFYGHFGQGLVHTRISFDLKSASGIQQFRAFISDAAELVSSFGGSLSGEHGDGQARGEFLVKEFGPELIEAFRDFKRAWDPDWRMNPGKVIDPYRVDENLRLGADYNPPSPLTVFEYPADNGSFARATMRCVGVGKCRSHEGGTMCPSYRVTREEEHSTRGRARLLFEMMQGDLIADRWKSDAVHNALDLCLACKGCKDECPVHVDMATYKAEFLHRYYKGRLRPRHAYAFGWIHRWARAASLAPNIVNFFTQTPGLSSLAKAAAGMTQQRPIPQFAAETFRKQFAEREHPKHGTPVLLWPDTFNNHFRPETALAAVRVLENAGCRVEIPSRPLCCGRPLYDYGMLGEAKRLLRQTLQTLHPHLRAGTPIVALEPSCAAVFRDELPAMLPHSEDGKRMSRLTHTLGEYLTNAGYEPPKAEGRLLLHGHCHHKAVLELGPEEALLDKMGFERHTLDSGCCGMAGSFGFEAEKFDVSRAVGELKLLPAVREADANTVIVADGFSCRTQVENLTDRQPKHLAEVMDSAQQKNSPSVQRRIRTSKLRQWTPLERALGIALAAGALMFGVMKLRRASPGEEA